MDNMEIVQNTEDMNYGEDICYCRKCRGVVYEVKAGDTIYSISRRYGITVNDVLNSNRFVNIYNLQIGDKLCIPVGNTERPPMRPVPSVPTRPGRPNTIMPRDDDMMENEAVTVGAWMDYDRNGAFEKNEIDDWDDMEEEYYENNDATNKYKDNLYKPMMEAPCKDCVSCKFDRNTKMADICSDPDMTFEEFVNCFKMFDK